MARRRDYAAEYRRRVRGTRPGTEARSRARGHRGPSDFEAALASDRTVRVEIRGKYSDQVIARVIDTRGRVRTFMVQRRPPKDEPAEADLDRTRNRYKDIADDHDVDLDWNVSP